MIESKLFQMYHLKEMSFSAELFLSCSILQLTFYAVGTAYQRKHGYILLSQQVYHVGALLLGLAALLLLNEDLLINNSLSSNDFIINDYLSFATKLVISLTSLLFLLIVKTSYSDDELVHNNFEYVVLVTISVLGLMLLCSSNDLITAYLSIELQSVAFYIMAAFKRNSSYSIESGLKYFIIGSLSSAFFLFGSALVYGCVGSLNFDDFKMFFPLLTLSLVGSASLVAAENLQTLTVNKNIIMNTLSQYNSEEKSTFLNWVNNEYGDKVIESSLFSEIPSKFSSSDVLAYTDNSVVKVSSDTSLFSEMQEKVSLPELPSSDNVSVYNDMIESFNSTLFDGSITIGSSLFSLDLVIIGFLLICISLLIKLAIAPFHYWSLDVYEGSPNATTFFFAVVPKMGIFVLLLRICYVSFYEIFSFNYQFYFFLFAVFSIFVGSVGGLEQRKVKSLLAYSSVSHTGYLLLSFSTNTFEGVQMMLYYLVIFMIAGLCFWSVFLFVKQKRNYYFNKHNKELGDFVLLSKSNPMIAFIFALTLFSIAGIPPIVGFLAKIGIFLVVIESSFYMIAVISILFSVISTFYYIRVIKVLYFENILVGKLYLPVSTKKSLIISVLALLLIVLCIDPMIIYFMFHKATLLSTQ